MNLVIITGACMGVIAFLSGIVLLIASKKFAVQENPLIDDVEALLPGANCGGCGYAGCRSFAEAVVNTKNTDLLCPVAGQKAMASAFKIVGLDFSGSVRKVARVMCQGGSNSVRSGQYQGIASCSAAQIANLIDLVCPYGCLGYGECMVACPFDAIRMIDGVAVVDEDACTACGKCIKACPRNLISLVPYDKKVYVACKSPESGAAVKKYCSVGCIGCKLCVKACQFEAIDYQPFLSTIIPDKCTQCMACVEKCPTKSILINKPISEIEAAKENKVHETANV